MSNEAKLPDFNQFSRWLASRMNRPGITAERYPELESAARDARHEFLETRRESMPQSSSAQADGGVDAEGSVEVLQLLAAAQSDASLPPEITTPRGFRISFADEDDTDGTPSSMVVLVTCPPELSTSIEGKMVYLWKDEERFELGQFDAEGKAIGTLPAGVEISAADFTQGKVKLEAPDAE